MKKAKLSVTEEPLEIIIARYWPTNIIKSIFIKKPKDESSFRNDVTLDREQAKYLYEQLDLIYGKKEQDGQNRK